LWEGCLISKLGIILLFVLSVILLLLLYSVGVQDHPNNASPDRLENSGLYELYDDFSTGYLNPDLWQTTRKGDFNESYIDVFDIDPSNKIDNRLRLGINTIGTADATVKLLGVRSMKTVNFTDKKEISLDLDWNNQSNGCYLAASVIICPTITEGNPEEERDWLKFEYIGVPPGYHARCNIMTKTNGHVKYLYTEGWPEQRTGREIGNQKIRMQLDKNQLTIIENEAEIFSTPSHGLEFTSAYLYLQVSSHSNYPTREILFDNISVVPFLFD